MKMRKRVMMDSGKDKGQLDATARRLNAILDGK